MEISVSCGWPKYAQGDRKFNGFEELYHWLLTIKGLPKRYVAGILFDVAKSGLLTRGTKHYSLHFRTDFHGYMITWKTAFKAGLVYTRDPLDSLGLVSEDQDKALAFARALDKEKKLPSWKGTMRGD